MAPSQNRTTEITAQGTEKLYQSYNALGVDEKLAFLYYVYEAMGSSITPAAPNAADIGLSETLIQELYNLSESDQLDAMRSIVKGEKTPISQSYGGLSANNQLLVWYVWAEEMGNRVVDMPQDYEASNAIQQLLNQVKSLGFEEQISLLREAATHMGYSEIGAPPSQAETGKTDSL